VSKNDIFAYTTDLNILLCRSTDFLIELYENNTPRVSIPIVNKQTAPPYAPTNTSSVILGYNPVDLANHCDIQ